MRSKNHLEAEYTMTDPENDQPQERQAEKQRPSRHLR